ncbi:sensor histidine kinase [Maribellus maritimus]|uniref:sensor histidine kinase n=1 Tax=Maribellus maritimus TaxID=2870838 RepID=UPI001EEA81E1|nr:histidine kinase [Maribellus maritimus]MCG6189294.1 histidine kinase [Maribellus maritimus]
MTLNFKDIFNQFIRNRILQHILFWALSFLILVNILKVSAEIKKIDLIYTAVFHLPVFLIVYLNLKVLFPYFLEKGRYFLFVVLALTVIAVGAGFYLILFNQWIDYIFTGYYFIAFYSFWDISLYYLIYIFLTSLLRLARGWFKLQEIENERAETELKALRSQINPHFLFNSLNSIYSLSRKNSPAVPEKIVQLSDLMRHIIYESDANFIPLEKEIEMVRNYIELQNLRTVKTEKINLEIKGDIQNKKIAPLVFLPFVENSFKHGLKSGAENAYVNICVRIRETDIVFEIENTKGDSPVLTDSKYKGIGIQNVKKRLELLYPNAHKFEITEDEKRFKVFLQIYLN